MEGLVFCSEILVRVSIDCMVLSCVLHTVCMGKKPVKQHRLSGVFAWRDGIDQMMMMKMKCLPYPFGVVYFKSLSLNGRFCRNIILVIKKSKNRRENCGTRKRK